MYKIYVDASDRKNNSVKLIQYTDSTEKIVDQVAGDIDIVTGIQDLLVKNKLSMQDITKFESFPGPGSFTGLKKSFTITNVLNWALGIKKDPHKFDTPNYGKEPNIG